MKEKIQLKNWNKPDLSVRNQVAIRFIPVAAWWCLWLPMNSVKNKMAFYNLKVYYHFKVSYGVTVNTCTGDATEMPLSTNMRDLALDGSLIQLLLLKLHFNVCNYTDVKFVKTKICTYNCPFADQDTYPKARRMCLLYSHC